METGEGTPFPLWIYCFLVISSVPKVSPTGQKCNGEGGLFPSSGGLLVADFDANTTITCGASPPVRPVFALLVDGIVVEPEAVFGVVGKDRQGVNLEAVVEVLLKVLVDKPFGVVGPAEGGL